MGTHDHWEFRAAGVSAEIGRSVVTEHKRLLESSFEFVLSIAIFVADDDEIASRNALFQL